MSWNGMAVVSALAVLAFMGAQTRTADSLITPANAHQLIGTDTSIVVLDVRTADEYYSDTGHLPKAVLVPVQALEDRMNALDQYKNRTIVVYCRSGHRSTEAAKTLRKHGFHVLNLEGGIMQWAKEGYPVVKEKR